LEVVTSLVKRPALRFGASQLFHGTDPPIAVLLEDGCEAFQPGRPFRCGDGNGAGGYGGTDVGRESNGLGVP
jgi:hypothetical protein